MFPNSKVKKLLFLIPITIFVVLFYLTLRGVVQIPTSLNLFGLQFRLYGLIIATAALTATYFVEKNINEEYKKYVGDAFIIILLGGVIGARLWHVATDFYLYEDNFVSVFKIWNGGLSIFGGLLGGFTFGAIYLKIKKIPILYCADLVAIFLPLAQAIGRLANFVNQELYGGPTNLPWGMYVRIENRISQFKQFEFFHPTFLYESIGNLILFAILYRKFKRDGLQSDGKFVSIYLIGYGLVRLLVNFIRIDTNTVFNVSQMAVGLMILGGVSIALLDLFRKKGQS